MKNLLLTAVSVIAISTAPLAAGSVSDAVIEPPVIVEEAASSSTGVLLPIILLVLVAAAVSSDSGSTALTSDATLKTDVTRVGTTLHGLPLYQYRYIGLPQVFEGVMAQDVAQIMPEAITLHKAGFMMVNYDMLGLEMRLVD